ncbi:hypothetical protein P9139_03315 [Curtobacterium flaccumfaciens]|nr:hypothetical protein P9139_03315 [Curtobacterium flaccumfaciens]
MTFDLSAQTLADADDAARAITRFDAEYEDFPAPFAGVLLRTESASSSEIEHLTAGARAISEAEIDGRINGNAPQIVRNIRAMQAAVALADDIGNDTIIAMHRELLDDVTPDSSDGTARSRSGSADGSPPRGVRSPTPRARP